MPSHYDDYNPEMAPTYTGEQPGAIRSFFNQLLGIEPGVDRYEDVYAEGVPSYDIASGDVRPIGRRAIRYGDAPPQGTPVDPDNPLPWLNPPGRNPTDREFSPTNEEITAEEFGDVGYTGPPPAIRGSGMETNEDRQRRIDESNNSMVGQLGNEELMDSTPFEVDYLGDGSELAEVGTDVSGEVPGEVPVNKYPPGTLMHWLNSAPETDPNAAGGRLGALKRQQAIVPDVSQMTESVGGRKQPPPRIASPDVVPPKPAAAPVNPRANVAGSAGGQDVSSGTGPDLKGRGGRGGTSPAPTINPPPMTPTPLPMNPPVGQGMEGGPPQTQALVNAIYQAMPTIPASRTEPQFTAQGHRMGGNVPGNVGPSRFTYQGAFTPKPDGFSGTSPQPHAIPQTLQDFQSRYGPKR